MDEPIPDGVTQRWFEYWRLRSGSRGQRTALEMGQPAEVIAAHDFVSSQVEAGGSAAVRLLAVLAEAAPDDDGGVMVGAGPIEDLLEIHGDEIVDLLVDAARRAPALARAMAHVDLSGQAVSSESLTRLKRVGLR